MKDGYQRFCSDTSPLSALEDFIGKWCDNNAAAWTALFHPEKETSGKSNHMIVLGLGFTHHEASAALVIDGELKTAIARERLTRLKRDGIAFGSRQLSMDIVIQYCLDEHGLSLSDVDLLVWNHVDHLGFRDATHGLA